PFPEIRLLLARPIDDGHCPSSPQIIPEPERAGVRERADQVLAVTITAVEARNVVIPLDQPVRMAGLTVSERDFTLVRIEAKGCAAGVGYTLARGADVAGIVERHLTPLLVGEDALLTERLWERMYRGTLFLGRKGLLMRALSAVDIALWDLKG